MSYQVALTFEDGVTRFVRCAPDQTVADASYQARINIPLDCRDGACGTCKARCESGSFDGGDYLPDALSPDEERAGYVLPCSLRPRSDLVLRIASSSAVVKTQAATHRATVTELRRLSPTTIALRVALDERAALAFLPGQYVNIAVPGAQVTRSYSFSCAPDSDELSFLVKLTPGGAMSTYLAQRASVGDTLELTGPHGSFFLREGDAPLLLVAGGTGLAPILSILRTLRAAGSTRPAHLLYGVSTDDDLVELQTLRQLAAEYPGLTWDYCVADERSTAPKRGFVTELLDIAQLHAGAAAVYLCGPPPMVEAVRDRLARLGVAPTGFYFEKFALAPPTPASQAPVPEGAASQGTASSGSRPGVEEPGVEEPGVEEPGVEEPGVEEPGVRGTIARGARVDAGAVMDDAAEDEERILELGGEGRELAGQRVFPAVDRAPRHAGRAAEQTSPDGYQIGEEHPSVYRSDAIFDARRALELGALELTIGRLNSSQLTGYRLLAEATLPHVSGDQFVDAAAYTEANAAFHDYLFGLTGNDHLLRAYRALGVRGHMDSALRTASWCHPRCTQDHLDIVTAFERGDRAGARALIIEHAERSKETTRRAMHELDQARRPRFVTPGRFAGQVVLVTGAGQGIGERTARRIHAEGGELVLADRAEHIGQLAAELSGEGPAAIGVTEDLETWQGACASVDAALARFGRIDVAVHTVGGTIWAKPFAHYPPEQVEAEIRRSLFPTLWCCRAVAPHMIAQGRGTIVNVSSVATRGVNRVPYAAAKGGVNAITSALALELAPHGIRVVATAPGGTDAPPRRTPRGPAPSCDQELGWYRELVDQTVESSLLKRYGTLDEQAAAITFLASQESSYITGTVLPVAGGDLG